MVTSVNTEIEKDANIRERHAGIYEGKSTKNLVCGMIAAGGNPLDWVPEGGESKEEVDRILEMFLQKLGALVDSGNDRKVILVVTHGAVLVHLWNYLLRQSDKYMLLNWKPEFFKVSRNTNYFLLDIGKSLAAGGPREMEVLIAHGNDHLKSLGDDALSSFFKEDKSVTALSECMQQ
ncbi:unnamed protein product [Allacma fusca]|uniref:Phosphoglycerate mutase-like protein n=1 Tax=Allacma fusca TaxID=39272 RepID=A0A8J2L390_9HEXA|nr:unnamed protein product [Allacma fusca]